MKVTELPQFMLKPLPASRVKKHTQTLLMTQLRHTRGDRVEVAICENITATRSASRAGVWTKWDDKKYVDHESAVAHAVAYEEKVAGRGYACLVQTGLLLPLNDTDVRHLRSEFLLPRAILEYGSDLFDSIYEWHTVETSKAFSGSSTSGAPSAAPHAAPTSSTPPPAAPAIDPTVTSIDGLLGVLDSVSSKVADATKE